MQRGYALQHFSTSYMGRWVQFTVGVTLLSLGVAMMVRAEIGLGPWDVLHQGMSFWTGMGIGLASIVAGVITMLLWIPLGERPGWGTLANILVIGIQIDLFLFVMPTIMYASMPLVAGLLLQLAMMVGGVIIMGIGVGIYLDSNLGAGARDGLMMGLVRRTGWSVRLIRTLLELAVLLLGWLLGGTIGLGTVLFAFGIGPVVQVTLQFLRRWKGEAA